MAAAWCVAMVITSVRWLAALVKAHLPELADATNWYTWLWYSFLQQRFHNGHLGTYTKQQEVYGVILKPVQQIAFQKR